MHRLSHCLVSLVLVLCLSCASLTASAVDRSTYNAVVGYGSTISADDILISSTVGGTPDVSIGGFRKTTGNAAYNTFQFVSSDKQVSGVQGHAFVNFELGTITQVVNINSSLASTLRGSTQFVAYLASEPIRGTGAGWIEGSLVSPATWTYTVEQSGAHEKITKSGSGNKITFDLFELDGIFSLTIKWDFGVRSMKIPNFSGDTVYLGFRTNTTVYTGTATSDNAKQDQVIDGINESNSLLSDVSNGITSVWQAIVNLPGKIAESIKGLFIPDESQFNILRGKWQEFLTTKMGFIYQMFQWVDTFFEGIIDNLTGDDTGAFEIPAFPAFEAGGETVQLWTEPLTVDFSDNAFVQTLQPIACPFILGVTAYHLWFAMSDLMECFFAGKSYRDYSHRRDDE